jgi:hypothetical protein
MARTIAGLLEHAAFVQERWQAVSGAVGDMPGDLLVRWEHFAAFPLAQLRARQSEPYDMLGQPAFRFWFLIRNDEPRLAIEDTGKAWSRDGEEINLLTRRKKAGTLYRAVAALSTDVFS